MTRYGSGMTKTANQALRRFLIAEREGRTAEADRALVSVLGDLPLASPSAGFADRVLERTGLTRAERPFPWWGRAAAAASLALSGLGLAVVVPIVLSAFQLLDPTVAVHGVVRSFETVTQWVFELRPFWDLVGRLQEALLTVIGTPQMSVAIALCLLASCAALRGLTELLSPQRSSAHVPA